MTQYPLESMRVIDFGWVGVAPNISCILADMGAEVIKVESRNRLDYLRLLPRPNIPEKEGDRATDHDDQAEAIDVVPLFHNFNRGKIGITVNIQHSKSAPLLKELIKKSDAVVENFAPGAMKRAGLDYESLKKVKPDIVMLSVPAGGQYGPYSNMRSFAPALLSIVGIQSMVGYYGERVLGELIYGYGDYTNALHGAFALLVALYHRKKTGEGQYIDMSQIEATVGLVNEAIMDYTMNDRIMGTQGNYHPTMAPHGNYPCKGEDKWVSIAVKSEDEWEKLCEAMGNPPWVKDDGFIDRFSRLKNWRELDKCVSQWTINYTRYEVTEILQNAGVAAAPVLSVEEMELDPHFAEREISVEKADPKLGKYKLNKTGWRLSETPGGIRGVAPKLGEHNDYVFGELLGLSGSEIAELIEEKVLY